MLFPLVLIFGLFYFLIMRPERKKQADHRLLLESLKKNDRVVTIGGIKSLLPRPRGPREVLRVKVAVQRVEVPAGEFGIEPLHSGPVLERAVLHRDSHGDSYPLVEGGEIPQSARSGNRPVDDGIEC